MGKDGVSKSRGVAAFSLLAFSSERVTGPGSSAQIKDLTMPVPPEYTCNGTE